MDLLGMLPLLEGWTEIRFIDTEPVGAGKKKEVYSSSDEEAGWFIGARVTSNVPDAGLRIEYDPAFGSTTEFRLIASELEGKGYTFTSTMPFVAVYSPGTNEYAVELSPNPPLAIKGRMRIELIGGSSDATLNYEVLLIRVTNMDLFIGSLRALMPQLQVQVPAQPPTPGLPAPAPRIIREYEGFLP